MTTNVVEPAILRYKLGGKGLKIDLKGLKTMFLTMITSSFFAENLLADLGGTPPPPLYGQYFWWKIFGRFWGSAKKYLKRLPFLGPASTWLECLFSRWKNDKDLQHNDQNTKHRGLHYLAHNIWNIGNRPRFQSSPSESSLSWEMQKCSSFSSWQKTKR